MGNAVLKALYAENFAAFAERVVFTTEANLSKKEHLEENTFEVGDSRYNKVSFLYGANGSGKTYFCKILREIQRLIKYSPFAFAGNAEFFAHPQFKGLDAPVQPFAFGTEYQSRPTYLGIDIIIDGITYHYEFGIQGKTIVREVLTKKHRRTEILLDRTSPSFNDIVLRSELKQFDLLKDCVKEETLCLPIAALLNNDLAEEIVYAIQDIQIINMTAAHLAPANAENSFCEERLNKYLSVLQKADPTLSEITVSFEEKEIGREKVDSNDFENREVIAKKMVVAVSTVHTIDDNGVPTQGTPISFFADESLGTVKLFTALPFIFDALENGEVLVVDELENGLHLSLAKEIVDLFTNETTNPNNAQLICTSHQPLLLDGDFRRDQVWVTHKDDHGKCELRRMSEFKTTRAKVNLTNRIIEGALGCNPSRFFDNYT